MTKEIQITIVDIKLFSKQPESQLPRNYPSCNKVGFEGRPQTQAGSVLPQKCREDLARNGVVKLKLIAVLSDELAKHDTSPQPYHYPGRSQRPAQVAMGKSEDEMETDKRYDSQSQLLRSSLAVAKEMTSDEAAETTLVLSIETSPIPSNTCYAQRPAQSDKTAFHRK